MNTYTPIGTRYNEKLLLPIFRMTNKLVLHGVQYTMTESWKTKTLQQITFIVDDERTLV